MLLNEQQKTEYIAKGLAVSVGIAIGNIVLMDEYGRQALFTHVLPDQVPHEIDRLNKAIESAQLHLENIKQRLEKKFGINQGYILDPHILMLKDPLLLQNIEQIIKSKKVNAEWGVKLATDQLLEICTSIQDEYLRERYNDIKDVASRLLEGLSGNRSNQLHLIHPSIVVAKDILPTAMAELNLINVLGIATDIGGWTSHTAIIARGIGIPAVVGLGDFSSKVNNGDCCIVDGKKGQVIINPSDQTKSSYSKKQLSYSYSNNDILNEALLPPITLDGKQCSVCANIEFVSELDVLTKYGANGIGLFRSEFLLSNCKTVSDFPSEEEQFLVYRQLLEAAGNNNVVVRVFDLSSDKIKPKELSSEEKNPALGLQGIRFLLQFEQILKVQLRALLRANSNGRLKVMLPKIVCISELRAVKKLIREIQQELNKDGLEYSKQISIGVMIEIPSAVFISDLLAKEADFLSIGSNDLIQYLLAVDRINTEMTNKYEPMHPAVLRSLRQVVRSANEFSKPVQICGEMATSLPYIVVLIGLGLYSFSMSPAIIPKVKQLIRNLEVPKAQQLFELVSKTNISEEAEQCLRKELPVLFPNFF